MFSSRVPHDLTPNKVTQCLERLRAEGTPLVDLTESNPTRAGIEYPAGLLDALAAPAAQVYDPRPFDLPEAREAVSRHLARRGVAVTPEPRGSDGEHERGLLLAVQAAVQPG